MARHVMVAFTNPTPGREDEFHRWDDEVHLREVLAAGGMISVQRYVTRTRDATAAR